MGKMLLDMFSGTHSVGKVAHDLGYDVVSLDLADATICCDVLEWDYTQYPVGYFDVVWASPPCETFSSVRRSNIGRNGYTRESIEHDMLERGVPILPLTRAAPSLQPLHCRPSPWLGFLGVIVIAGGVDGMSAQPYL